MFPFKPPTHGLYPYYSVCFARNLSKQNFCFDPREGRRMVNSFLTGLYDNDVTFGIQRVGGPDDTTLYKCCRTPPGYYIDYLSCYYKMTHDQYYEYYNAPFFLVFCDTGHVVTGMARKINPYVNEYNLDWIQCCRVGVGPGPVWPVLGPSYLLHGLSGRSDHGFIGHRAENTASVGHILAMQ
ncbi:uncharacterized protein LOC129595902 [Paramacrobiotus metropolitanus]|uniref:uncharacterized protein LOC129595902 n=1 Tax=Paramacrobiotus metropolitanus TaxID=2943436 RepID=UPI002445F219|nr:uncharacterized protein LOC129595902 [Paramacrobiotus metropolitanus]